MNSSCSCTTLNGRRGQLTNKAAFENAHSAMASSGPRDHIQVIRRFAFADSSADSSLGLGLGLGPGLGLGRVKVRIREG